MQHRDYDPDDVRPVDNETLTLHSFGHEAGMPDKLLIGALVRRYLGDATAAWGPEGCSLVIPTLARAAPQDYGRAGPPYLRGSKTCADVLTKLFTHVHRQLADETRALTVSSVRVEGDRAFALLDVGKKRERQIMLQRVDGTWKIGSLLDGPMTHIE